MRFFSKLPLKRAFSTLLTSRPSDKVKNLIVRDAQSCFSTFFTHPIVTTRFSTIPFMLAMLILRTNMATTTEKQTSTISSEFPTLEQPNNRLKDKIVVITAGHRGGGAVLAETFAASGATVIIIAPKESKPNPRFDEVANKIRLKGGKAKTFEVNMSSEEAIAAAVGIIGSEYGRIDVLINNFSNFHFKPAIETTEADFHRVMQNPFATLFFSRACIPYLTHSVNPHVINISPPIEMSSLELAAEHHPLFAMSKYSMTILAFGMAREYKAEGIAFNALWQERPVITPTLTSNFPQEVLNGSNRPEIYAHAAYLMALKSAKEFTGQALLDGDFLRKEGFDTQPYAYDANAKPIVDIYCSGVDYSILKPVLNPSTSVDNNENSTKMRNAK